MESKMVALRVQKSSFAQLLALLRAVATSIGMHSVTSGVHAAYVSIREAYVSIRVACTP